MPKWCWIILSHAQRRQSWGSDWTKTLQHIANMLARPPCTWETCWFLKSNSFKAVGRFLDIHSLAQFGFTNNTRSLRTHHFRSPASPNPASSTGTDKCILRAWFGLMPKIAAWQTNMDGAKSLGAPTCTCLAPQCTCTNIAKKQDAPIPKRSEKGQRVSAETKIFVVFLCVWTLEPFGQTAQKRSETRSRTGCKPTWAQWKPAVHGWKSSTK